MESLAGCDITELELKAGEAKHEEADHVEKRQEPPLSDTTATTSNLGVPADTIASLDDRSTSGKEAQDDIVSAEASKANGGALTAAGPQANDKPTTKEIGHNAQCNLCGVYPITGPLFHCTQYVQSARSCYKY